MTVAPELVELTAAERVQQDQNRADFMEFLYLADGRDDSEHPYAHTYTGLFEAYCYGLGRAMLAGLIETWHEYETNEAGVVALREA